MILRFILFVGTVLACVFGAHYLLYRSATAFFDIANPATRKVLFIVFAFLSVSFIASVALIHAWQNPVSRVFYIAAASWMGLLVYLVMAAVACWIAALIGRLAGFALPMQAVAGAALAMAVCVGAWGAWNAQHPVVTRVDVRIKNLPEAWKGKTLVQLSDMHLGRINGIGFLQRVVEQVNALKPNLVVITGDLFDGMGADFGRFAREIDRIASPNGVIMVMGNHETYINLETSRAAIRKTHIRLLDNEVADIDGLQIVGIAFPDPHGAWAGKGLKEVRDKLSKDKPSVLLFHTPTQVDLQRDSLVDQHFSTYWTPETRFDANRAMGIDLQLSGHTHAGQMFPFNLLTRVIYKGFDYGLNHVGDFSIYTSSGTGTWGPPYRVGTRSEIVAITLR